MKIRRRSFRNYWVRAMVSKLGDYWKLQHCKLRHFKFRNAATCNVSTYNRIFRLLVPLCLCVYLTVNAHGQAFPRPRPDTGPKPKNVHGLVLDIRGQVLPGALVFIRDMKTKVTRTLE